MTTFRPVIAAIRILDVLAHVNADGPVRLGDLARKTELSPPTTLRMVETLEAAGYVRRLQPGGLIVVTSKVRELSAGCDLGRDVEAAAGEILVELQRTTGWPSDIAVPSEGAMLVVSTSRGDSQFFANRRPGYRAPMLQTSLGRAFLAWSDDHQRRQALPNGSVSPEARRLLDAVRAQGYATMGEDYSASEYGGAVSALAVPVLADGGPVAALNIMYLRHAHSEQEAASRLLGPLLRAADAISIGLRYGGDTAGADR